MKRMKVVIVTTQSLCVLLYCAFGIFGYLTFNGNVDGNVLNNYSVHDLVVDAGR
jgi:amino acid permease